MKKRYAVKYIISCLLAVIMLFTNSVSIADFFAVSYTTYDTTYEKILELYLKIINGLGSVDYGRHDLFNDAIYGSYDPMDGYKTIISAVKKDCGYMIYDVNMDGVNELLIGSNGGSINSVFTMDNGKVRELIRAGGHGTASSNYTCSMLADGNFYRWGHGGAGRDYYELWQMNGTGPVSFVEGYHTDLIWNEADKTEDLNWYRSHASMSELTTSPNDRVDSTVGERWVRTQEQNVFNKKFVPFSVYEKYRDDPWNIAVLSIKGNTTSGNKVNVRKEASAGSKLVASKSVGTYVKVLSMEGDYFKIAFGNKEGYIQRDYLTPLTYMIPSGAAKGLLAGAEADVASDQETPQEETAITEGTETQEPYPAPAKTKKAKVNIREKTDKKSKLVGTINKKGSAVMVKGEAADKENVLWYIVEYNGKEGYVRNDFIELEEPKAAAASDGELYGLVIKKLATRSGPSPRAEDTGTYSVKGKRLRVYSRAYDPIENAWWVKCDVPYLGEIRTLWAWYTRFDSKSLPLESIPIEENVQMDSSGNSNQSQPVAGQDTAGTQNSGSSGNAEYDSVTDKEASVFTGTLRLGSEGDSVFTLKSRLFDLEYYSGYVDDVFDDYTRTAVLKFQKVNGLEEDGVVGKKTWSLLLSSNAKPKPRTDVDYIDVIDHYEDIEVQKSRQVWDHDEVTVVDNGDGTFSEVTQPVYRTEYYTETERRPVYREELFPHDNY